MSKAEIPVPDRLPRRPHPFITATREAATGLKPGDDGRLDIGRKKGIVHLRVARAQIQRALRIAQAIISEAESRGYRAAPVDRSYKLPAGVGIAIGEQVYGFQINELVDKVPLTEDDLKRWRRDNEHRLRWRLGGDPPAPPATKAIANGRLGIELERSYWGRHRSNWREGPRGPLEAKLPSVFEELEVRAEEDQKRAEQFARERVERERLEAERRERARLIQIENRRAERLFNGAEAWRRATDARTYLAALRERLDELDPDERDRIGAWCDWGERFLDHYDPVLNTHEQIRGLDDEEDGKSTVAPWR